ncbi:MAG TPA: hypothetical protein VEF91_03905 [Verrucomicrobiae bacterium]|nr:hypothetical protein [Verrucomicrobiae bacterium]
MRDESDKTMWGHVEKLGKGTRANYDPDKKTITFCFKRNPQTSGEQLRRLREALMKELKELGYSSRMKYNGEVITENIETKDVTLVKKNHRLIIHLNKQPSEDKEKDVSKMQT